MSNKRGNAKKEDRIRLLTDCYDSFETKNTHIVFNYQFLTSGTDYGQSFLDWERDQIILDLNQKLQVFSCKTKKELLLDKTLVIYGSFPTSSHLKYPISLPHDSRRLIWARLRLTGKRRLVGFFSPGSDRESDVFYVVFLDKNHDFFPVEKSNT